MRLQFSSPTERHTFNAVKCRKESKRRPEGSEYFDERINEINERVRYQRSGIG